MHLKLALPTLCSCDQDITRGFQNMGIDPYILETAMGQLVWPFFEGRGLKVKKNHTCFFYFLTCTKEEEIIEPKRPILPSAGSETIYTWLYGVATANSDDSYRDPNMNNKDQGWVINLCLIIKLIRY